MGKKEKVSLEAMVVEQESKKTAAEQDATTSQRDNVTTSKRLQHTSLYLSPEVRRAIKEIAFTYDKKPHDLFIEGINLMLAKYGKAGSQELSQK